MRVLLFLIVLCTIATVSFAVPIMSRWPELADDRSLRERRQMGMMGPLGMMNGMGMGGMGYPMGGMGYPMGMGMG
ncbi:hypothetical protein TELCIR_05389 [Teladorsagia circumcincta]|uniref:Uncharacterized protein n=1 Tax=Teladorsagia circumcincta TaxID=45464 RepID=A0A2G9UQV8_TELCI|nr:hypothetical protein TELCIR_05389 [Teladorsagia circumcincta]